MDNIRLPNNIKKMLSTVIKKVEKTVPVSKVYLFGSYYNGTQSKDSDIDIAFFVNKNECLLDVTRKIIKITSKYPIDIQPQIFYESELKEKNGIVGEIIENGGEIHIEHNLEF